MAANDLYRHGALSGTEVLVAVGPASERLALRISPAGELAWVHVGGEDNDCPILNGTRLSTRKTFGLFPVAFGPYRMPSMPAFASGLYVYHADDIADCRLTVYDVQTRQHMTFASISEDGVAGIAYVTDEGRVVMNADPPNFRRVMPNGELWAVCRETANYIVGAFGRGDDYPAALSKLDKRTGEVTRWLGFTPVPHDALETPDGRLLVFINGTPTSPEPDQVEWVKEFPPEAVRVPPPIPLLGLVPPTEPFPEAWCGTNQDGGFVAAGNACWSAGPEE